MNIDIHLKVSWLTHPKRKKLERRLGAKGVLSFIDLLLSVAQDKPTGHLTGWSIEDVAIAAGWNDDPNVLVNALLDYRLLDKGDDGSLSIHDWGEHNSFAVTAPQRSEKARRAAIKRWENVRLSDAKLCDKQCSEHDLAMPKQTNERTNNTYIQTTTPPTPSTPGASNGSLLSSSPLEMEKQKTLSSLLSLIPQEHHSQDLQSLIAVAFVEHGEEFVRSNIAYTNRRKRENYVGYLCSAFDKDYAQKARQDEERNRAGREKALDKKAEEERARKEEAEKDQEARTAFFELPQPERDRYIDEALKGFSPGLRPKSRESPLAISVAISKFMESHIPAGE